MGEYAHALKPPIDIDPSALARLTLRQNARGA
jgi:hypothetical protein